MLLYRNRRRSRFCRALCPSAMGTCEKAAGFFAVFLSLLRGWSQQECTTALEAVGTEISSSRVRIKLALTMVHAACFILDTSLHGGAADVERVSISVRGGTAERRRDRISTRHCEHRVDKAGRPACMLLSGRALWTRQWDKQLDGKMRYRRAWMGRYGTDATAHETWERVLSGETTLAKKDLSCDLVCQSPPDRRHVRFR